MESTNALPRLLAGSQLGSPADLDRHLELHGSPAVPAQRAGREMIDIVARSGLKGRGGSGFPCAVKLGAVADAPRRRRRVVVANGVEGEPESRKDSTLLSCSPHLVLDGLAVAAACVGADEAIICVKGDDSEAVGAVRAAISERSALDAVQAELVEVPSSYLAGEETALVNFIDTGSVLPTFIPPRPHERGVGGRPTLVQNVETLAHLALIARRGAEWFRAVGSEEDPGSTLVTVAGAVGAPGVYEIPASMPLGALIDHAGGYSEAAQAVLLGGHEGTWWAAQEIAGLRLGHAAMLARGGNLGPGVIYVLARSDCPVAESAKIARYLADHSAGQCGPCTFGLPAIAGALEAIADGHCEPGTHRWAAHWSAQVSRRGACHHPDGAIRFVASALDVFADDITRHETGDACMATSSGVAAGAAAE